MKKKNNNLYVYKMRRDQFRTMENKFLEVFYQILLVQETEEGSFYLHKRNDLKQYRHILNILLNEILKINDLNYQRGIYYEVVLSAGGIHLSGEEKECQTCNQYFKKSGILEYVWGAYQLHISALLVRAAEDVEAGQKYADNILKLLEVRYGINSPEYALMKLHVIREYYFKYKKSLFIDEMKENYDYLKTYASKNSCLFCEVLSMQSYVLEQASDKGYELWLKRSDEEAEQKKEDEHYNFLKCKIAWVKASILQKQGQDAAALEILQEAITKYLKTDKEERYFYGQVYVMAAFICNNLENTAQMFHYAQDGLSICEKFNQCDSELYYNLYNYVGIFYLKNGSLGEAEKLYAGSIKKIEQKFGRENETYMDYMNNLAVIGMRQGKDVTPYFKEMKKVKDKRLRKKTRALLHNELLAKIVRGGHYNKTEMDYEDNLKEIEMVYKACIRDLDEDDDKSEQERLDTIYLMALVNERKRDYGNKIPFLLQKLEKSYQNDYSKEMARIYWYSRMLWEWETNSPQSAWQISERLMQKIQKGDYEQYWNMVMNHIQLLIINGQYDTARTLMNELAELFQDRIMEKGCGNIFSYLTIIRCLVSMYIQILKCEGNISCLDEKECKILLEKIMYCKTIDRELKNILGKYEDDQMDMYYFRQNHRMLAALKMARERGSLDQADYEKKAMACRLELAEYEENLNRKIPFRQLLPGYEFGSIKVPPHTVCVEYFAYNNFIIDGPMFDAAVRAGEKEAVYSYLAIVLSGEKGKTEILDIIDIPIEPELDKEAEALLDENTRAENNVRKSEEEIIMDLKQSLASPVFKYVKGKEKIYLALDFTLQMLPMDLLFSDDNGEPMNIILVDSACYVEEDVQICMEKSDALVIGNPKLNLHGTQQEPPLPCGEMECIQIARMFQTKAYLGAEAKQKLLWGKKQKDMIHIAVHGEHITTDAKVQIFENLFVGFILKFAGYEDWKEGRRDKDYGNGVVPGDDFLFMDLTNTKLVVLSACESGVGFMGSLSAGHGIGWAIGVAGAQNTIATLWKVSDDSSAVLMILFYRNLRIMPIGDALHEAKKSLRTLTLEEIRKDNELRQILEISEKKEVYKNMADNDRPYAHWKKWAGFVCYHR